jgi:hypothetical protein
MHVWFLLLTASLFLFTGCKSFKSLRSTSRQLLSSQHEVAAAPNDLPRSDKERIHGVMLPSISLTLLSLGIMSSSVGARDDSVNDATQFRRSPRPLLYSVEMTNPPCLQPRTAKGELSAARRLAKANIVLLGEHRSSVEEDRRRDQALAASILTRILGNRDGKRRIGLGLDMVDSSQQKALDEYVQSAGVLSEADADASLLAACGEGIREYLPLLHIARLQQMRLVALGVPVEARKKIAENGLKALSEEEKSKYIADPEGFISLVRDPGFTTYTDKVIITGFNAAIQSGAISTSVTAESYFASRIFDDEALACSIAQKSLFDETMVVLLSSEAVKFGFGVEERLRRNLQQRKNLDEKVDVVSVLLNPTAEDSLSSTVQLQLALGYGPYLKDQKPLAEYLWFSNFPPVKILTRTKNPISAEGEKPPGESSIIGAF